MFCALARALMLIAALHAPQEAPPAALHDGQGHGPAPCATATPDKSRVA
ncbi:MAG: hypothetical protein V2I65_12895 [Paracoccaceae bacterium]|jgi:hypothetical protein|nr:hypothetical protein [Paracoccaceae bacterium]